MATQLATNGRGHAGMIPNTPMGLIKGSMINRDLCTVTLTRQFGKKPASTSQSPSSFILGPQCQNWLGGCTVEYRMYG